MQRGKTARKRRALQPSSFIRDLQAPDLEIQRDLQSILQCSAAEAHQILQSEKDALDKALHKRCRRHKPRDNEGVHAILGLASFLAELESGRRAMEIELSCPVKRPALRLKLPAKKPLFAAAETQTSDEEFGYAPEDSSCMLQIQTIMSALGLPLRLLAPAVVYHSTEESLEQADEVKGRAATHVLIACLINEARERLSDNA